MKTPMQELLERVKEYRDSETSPLVISRLNSVCVDIVGMLEKEKVNRRELLLDFADYSERDKTSQTTDECVDNYLDSTFNTKER